MPGSVLISGAGIAGLATANALGRAGFAVTVVEKGPELRPRGLGLSLQANGVAAIERLGLLDELDRRGVGCDKVVLAGADGTPLFEMDVARDADGRATMYSVHRNDLVDVLLAGNVAEIVLGCSIEGIDQDGDGVTARLSDGSEARYDVIIGADGIDSQVRSLVFDVPPEPRSYVAWRALVPMGDADPPEPVLRSGPESYFGTFQVDANHLYLFALRHVGDGDEVNTGSGGLVDLAERFEPFCRALARRVTDADQIHVPVREVVLDRWVDGRVALVGDAAHAIVPFLAQGAALALEDALTVSDALRDTTDAPKALAEWEASRRQRVEWVRSVCRVNGIRVGLEGAAATAALSQDELTDAIASVPAITAWPD